MHGRNAAEGPAGGERAAQGPWGPEVRRPRPPWMGSQSQLPASFPALALLPAGLPSPKAFIPPPCFHGIKRGGEAWLERHICPRFRKAAWRGG